MGKFYAVRSGRQTGIFTSWDQAKKQIHGFSGADYKSFTNKEEAQAFLNHKKVSKLPDGALIAYVDGSFSKVQRKYSYGGVLLQDGEIIKQFKKADSDPKYVESYQIAGECFGSIRAMYEGIQMGFAEIYIHYDYMGIEKWARKEWQANKPVSKDYVKYFDHFSKKIDAHFIKVKAHTGVEMNELADRLAKSALNE